MKKSSILLNRSKKRKISAIKADCSIGSTFKNCFSYESKYVRQGYDFVVGVDEAGRGPLAGPVVACAATVRKYQILNPKIQKIKKFERIKDSKLLSEKQREELYDFIHEHFHVGVGICDHRTIDRVNILNATYLAMKKAVTDLVSSIKYDASSIEKNKKNIIHNTSYIILVDGNKIIPNYSYKQKAIVGGDKLVKSISAASIIAKVTRDRIMREMDKKYQQYGFAQHKGYGTGMHREMIKKHGFCAIHRKSFKVK